jgi:hypothetical protein
VQATMKKKTWTTPSRFQQIPKYGIHSQRSVGKKVGYWINVPGGIEAKTGFSQYIATRAKNNL